MSKSVSLKVLEVIIYAGIFVAFIVPIFKPAEPQELSNNSQSSLIRPLIDMHYLYKRLS